MPSHYLNQCWNSVNTLWPRRDGRYFADDILKCIFLNENVWISLKIPLKFVPKGPINNIPALVQIMAWRRPGDKPLSELMMVSLLTHICVTRPQWVNWTLRNKLLWNFNWKCCLQNAAILVSASMCQLIGLCCCHMPQWNLIIFSSDNGLFADSTKPIPEPMLTNDYWKSCSICLMASFKLML